MRLKKIAAAVATTAIAVSGLNLAMAGPAAAAAGVWVPYGKINPITSSTNATWVCGRTDPIEGTAGKVIAQVCAIRSRTSRDRVQAAVIVKNNRSSLYATDAAAALWDVQRGRAVNRWECLRSGVAANTWSVCFGETISYSWNVYAQGGANGTELSPSLGV
jgi:hypothetical protein